MTRTVERLAESERAVMRICVVSVARSDYGIYRPLLRRLAADEAFEFQLVVAAMHLAPDYGNTIDEILADGYEIAARVEMTPQADTPGAVARAMGEGTTRFAEAYARLEPDLLVVLGDRYEMHAATVAALPFLIPTLHIAGGSLTLGAMDDGLRHSITKLSHLHFVETETYRDRVIQMGEEPWRVHTTGSLNLDNLNGFERLPLEDLNRRFGLSLTPDAPPLLVTFHPVTREYKNTRSYMEALLTALSTSPLPVVFTYPNADTNGRVIIDMIEDYTGGRDDAFAVPHFGVEGYNSLMAHAAAMVGNSSSGIIEAASFRLPVINIGTRQGGRLAPENVIDTGYEADSICKGIETGTSPAFRDKIAGLINPYGDGGAAERMIAVLKSTDLARSDLIEKVFYRPGGERN